MSAESEVTGSEDAAKTVQTGDEDAVHRSWADRHMWPGLEKVALSGAGRRFLPRSLGRFLLAVSALAGFRALDAERNREGRLPDDEEINVESIWVTECYPPSDLAGLIDGLESLRVGERWGDLPSVADYARLYRGGLYAGAGANLGFFTRRGESVLGADYVQTDLPRRIKRASGWLESVTPSLTAIAIQFELAEEARGFLNDVLKADYQTIRHGSIYVDPDNQRRQAMRRAVDELTRDCVSWMRQYFSGAFAGGLLGGDHPTCVFLTTKKTVPFQRTNRLIKWLWLTQLDAAHEAWDSEDWPGLHLRVPEREGERHRWWLAGRQGDFLNDESDQLQEAYGGATRFGWLNRIQHEMSLTLMLHATDSLMRGMHEVVARSRDTMGATVTRKWGTRRLAALRADVTYFVRDVEPVASALNSEDWRVQERAAFLPSTDSILALIHESEMQRARSSVPRGPVWRRLSSLLRQSKVPATHALNVEPLPTLTKYQANAIRHRAGLLLEATRQHRDALATVSTLFAAAESVRLDQRLLVLTVLLGVIAVLAALPTIAGLIQVLLRLLGIDISLVFDGTGAPSSSP